MITNFEIIEEEKNGVVILRVSGELDALVAPQLKDRLIKLMELDKSYFILDFEGLSHINSLAMGIIRGRLKEIREKNGEKLKIQISYNTNNPTDRSISEFLQGEFLKVGIELDLLGEEDQTYKDRLRAGKFQMAGYVSWGNPYEPHSFLGAMTSPIIYGDYAAQQGVPDKKEIDKSILKALESTSEEERQNNYKFVLERLHDEAVYIPISYERNRVVYSKKIKKVK